MLSSYFKALSSEQESASVVYNEGLKIKLGQIENIHFVGSNNNVSGTAVEYDVSVRDDFGGQSVFRNLQFLTDLGGKNDFSETIYENNEFASTGDLDTTNIFRNKNGSFVLIAFIDGSLDKPFILGALQHTGRVPGATVEDGIRYLQEFRGLITQIDKEGAAKLIYQGNRKPDGILERPDTGPTSVEVNNKGDVVFEQILNPQEGESVVQNRLEFKREAQTQTRSSGNGNITELVDGANEAVTLTFKSGLTVTIDGLGDRVDINTQGGSQIVLDGAAGTVAFGVNGVELLDQISQQLQQLIDWANNIGALHQHIGNLGYDSLIPNETADYIALGTELSNIQGLIDGITGSLG